MTKTLLSSIITVANLLVMQAKKTNLQTY